MFTFTRFIYKKQSVTKYFWKRSNNFTCGKQFLKYPTQHVNAKDCGDFHLRMHWCILEKSWNSKKQRTRKRREFRVFSTLSMLPSHWEMASCDWCFPKIAPCMSRIVFIRFKSAWIIVWSDCNVRSVWNSNPKTGTVKNIYLNQSKASALTL